MLQISEAYPEVVAMRSRDLVTGDWSTITYGQLQEQVTMVYCTVVYCTVLNCTVLYCTVLYLIGLGVHLGEDVGDLVVAHDHLPVAPPGTCHISYV